MAWLKYRPFCAQCGRPIDSLEETEHYGRMRLIARCHGETEIVDLDGNARGLVFGRAFSESARLGP